MKFSAALLSLALLLPCSILASPIPVSSNGLGMLFKGILPLRPYPSASSMRHSSTAGELALSHCIPAPPFLPRSTQSPFFFFLISTLYLRPHLALTPLIIIIIPHSPISTTITPQTTDTPSPLPSRPPVRLRRHGLPFRSRRRGWKPRPLRSQQG